MAATYPETKTMERIYTIANGVTGLTGRCSKGYKRWAESQNFETLVSALTSSQGYFWVNLKGVPSQGENEIKTFTLEGELVCYTDPQVSVDLVAQWELCLALRDALELSSSYGDEEFRPRVSPVFMGVKENGLIIFDFGAHGQGSMTVIDP